MSAIAYITDSKMLELHRLNNHKQVNFWRLSNNMNFSDFCEGDLVFFLSKDKEHRKKKEKGIVGFGRVISFELSSIRSMWDKYGVLNGYNSLIEFKEAIIRVSKDKKLPQKISSFLLDDVTFFQPVYLSDCGMEISSNVESYVYLKPEETVIKLLKMANGPKDLWSDLNQNDEAIRKEEIIYSLFQAQNKIGSISMNDNVSKKAKRAMKSFIKNNPDYRYIYRSENEVFRLKDNSLEIVMYDDKEIDWRLLIGQAHLYRYYFEKYYDEYLNVVFSCLSNNTTLNHHLNINE